MSFLIKMLGGYTAKEYKELKQKYENEVITKQDVENRLDNLKVENEKVLKANEALIRDNMKLKNQLAAIEQSDHVEVQNSSYYMYNSFENMFYVDSNGVRYIDARSDAIMKDNSFRAVYNKIWANDDNKKVTFKEFNDEFTKLYSYRDNKDIVDDYLRNQLIQVKHFTLEIDIKDIHNYTYNESGKLCYRSTMRPIYK